MNARHSTLPLIRLLARLGWQRDPDGWTVPCRDGHGRRARLRIALFETGVVITSSTPGPWRLTPLQVGRLRAGLRDAVISLGELSGDAVVASPPRPASRDVPRRLVRLNPPCRPTVADITARVAVSTSQIREVNHADHISTDDHTSTDDHPSRVSAA